jgi:hypothetical protein
MQRVGILTRTARAGAACYDSWGPLSAVVACPPGYTRRHATARTLLLNSASSGRRVSCVVSETEESTARAESRLCQWHAGTG